MKYTNLHGFFTHLKESEAHGMSPIYALAIPDRAERGAVVLAMASTVKRVASDSSWKEFVEELFTEDLFMSGRRFFFRELIEGDQEEIILRTYVQSPSLLHTVIFGTSSFKGLEALYNLGKKEMVVLDLTQEKPWERQKRIFAMLSSLLQKEGVDLSSDLFSMLWKRTDGNFSQMREEVCKLRTFSAFSREIRTADVELLTPEAPYENGFEWARKVIFAKETPPKELANDLSFTIPFIGQIRYFLYLGIKASEAHVQEGSPFSKVISHAEDAKLYAEILKRKGVSFFVMALHYLYECEKELKSSSLEGSILIDRFVGKLATL